MQTPTLAERLGYKPTDRLLIINGDDAGMSHSANVATIDCLERGVMTSATIMVPCPWFNEMARYAVENPKRDLGLHLTHTSEWRLYRWGPVASRNAVPGLVDPDGYLWPDVASVHQHARPEEAEIETRAQIQKALAAGIDVTHIDSHMGTLQLDPALHQVYIKLAKEFNLALRMGPPHRYIEAGLPNLRADTAAMGLVFPDWFVHDELKEMPADPRGFWLKTVRGIRPGVTEVYIHAAVDTPEIRAITGSWRVRVEEHAIFTGDEMRKAIEDEGIILIGYRRLRDLQRAGKSV